LVTRIIVQLLGRRRAARVQVIDLGSAGKALAQPHGGIDMVIMPEPLRADTFAPFGDVLEAPPAPGRLFFGEGLANRRQGAAPSLAVARVPPLASLPLTATRMERHEFSSQSFFALDVARWLVIVAPKAGNGRPDAAHARAFLAGPGQGVTYRVDTWHYPLTVLDREARFAVLIWLEHSQSDEEFVTLEEPFTVDVPG
jgi:ureidoglycolate lyase